MPRFDFAILAGSLSVLWEGTLVTVRITLLSFLVALLVGVTVGVARSRSPLVLRLLAPYVEIFRGTPLLIQLFFIYYGLPTIGITMSGTQAAVLGLGLNGGAYISEVVRGALLAVASSQEDAAKALGLSWLQSLFLVILPQAIPVAIPPLVNAFSALLKETSLVSVLAITELTRVGQLIYTRTFRAFEIYLAIGLIYFALTYLASRLSIFLERRFAIRNHC